MVALGEVEMSGYHINPNLVHEVNGFGEHKAGKLGLNGTIKVRHYFHTLIPTICIRKLYLFVTHLINMYSQPGRDDCLQINMTYTAIKSVSFR